jgi:hypothetical protein
MGNRAKNRLIYVPIGERVMNLLKIYQNRVAQVLYVSSSLLSKPSVNEGDKTKDRLLHLALLSE